jgi:putative tryptophan/tyrosine transport system substrate-binding protein
LGFLINPANQNAASHREHALRAAGSLGIRLHFLSAQRAEELDSAFSAARRSNVGALLVGDDPLFDVINQQLVETAARYRIPTMYYVRDFVVGGGLISYGPSFDEMSRQAGVYIGRILEGAKPAELPVQQPTKIELVINTKAAKALGITIPPALLASANEVIE